MLNISLHSIVMYMHRSIVLVPCSIIIPKGRKCLHPGDHVAVDLLVGVPLE